MKALSALLTFALMIIAPEPGPAQVQPELVEPKLNSIFPLGGRQGTRVLAEVRGNFLEGASSVWPDSEGLRGRILKVEASKEEVNPKLSPQNGKEKTPAEFQVSIEVEILPAASPGIHFLRLMTPLGISNALPFRVVNETVFEETSGPHETITQAQAVAFPVMINGRLGKPGELDYYSFQVKKGDELAFEVVMTLNCAPRLALFRDGASWLNPERPMPVLMNQEISSDLIQQHARGTYRFDQDGRYFLEVSSIFGKGGPGSSYQVRIAPARAASVDIFYGDKPGQASNAWSERSFTRELHKGWMELLERRSVKQTPGTSTVTRANAATGAGDMGPSAERQAEQESPVLARPDSTEENEPNENAAQAQGISIPALVHGAIGHPGDVDSFKFTVKSGQQLAFEIETPDTRPPYFNPRLGVVDAKDHELFSNVERRLSMFNNNADPQVYLKTVVPKALYTFLAGGEYVLQVRDITSRYGGPTFRYTLLVRPQVPHVGEVVVSEGDHINLIRGKAKKLNITAAYEEGFKGDISFFFTGLPDGVRAYPASQYDEGRPPMEITQNPEIVAPSEQKSVVVLLAGPEASLTSSPVRVQLHCRPIAQGQLGPDLLVREIPLTIVENISQSQKEKVSPSAQ